MEEINLHHFLSTLGQSDESDYLRIAQVRLIVMQTINELLGELEQHKIQIAKANRLMSSYPEDSEDRLIWASIRATAERTLPILKSRIEIIELHQEVIESKFTALTEKGLTLKSAIKSLPTGIHHDHAH